MTILETVYQLNLQGWHVSENSTRQGLLHVNKLTGFEGRWQVIHHHPYTVLDVGHNEDGIRQIVSQLEHCTYQTLHIVIGLVKDKEISKLLALLPKHAVYYFTKAAIPRALNEDELMTTAKSYGLNGHSFVSVAEAMQSAATRSETNDMILVCGSIFVVGEVGISEIKW